MHLSGVELIIVLLFMVVALAVFAFRFNIPYPMILLVGGAIIALLPGLPSVALQPDLVFVLFLPPILFSAAFFTSWRDFKANARPIGLLAIGGVLATMSLVAVVAHTVIPDMPWAVAFVIGAIVSPPDAIAATSIFVRLGVPHRIVTILEGESLVNDASALIAYRFAVAAVVTGAFSIWEASIQFVVAAVGGVILGLMIGWVMARVIPFITDPALTIATTLIVPLGTYLLAEEVHLSGVMATVAAGLLFGRLSSNSLNIEARAGGRAVWSTGILLVNGMVFILIGLQLGDVLDGLERGILNELLWQSVLISLAVIIARFVWVYPATILPRVFHPGIRERDPLPPHGAIFIIAWSGLRGVVSLASALALPLTLDDGTPFPFRQETILIAFVVIVVTLIGQGLLIPRFLRFFNLEDDGTPERELLVARRLAASAVLARLEELEKDDWVPLGHVIEIRTRFSHALEHLPDDGNLDAYDTDHIESHNRLRDEVLSAGRLAVLTARDQGRIGDDARHAVEQELDFESLRTEF